MKHPRGAAGTDLILFIFFLVALGIIWALTGGPDRPISTAGPFLNPPFPLGEGTAYTVPGVNIPSTPERRKRENRETRVGNIISNIRNSFTNISEDPSPYKELVSLSVGRARNSDPESEYVVLKTNKNISERVPISRWRIESSVTLAGTTLGDAAYLPYSGQVNSELPVTIPENTTVYIITGRSPIGTSFRTNTCTGYFAQFQDFEPELREECPLPEDELEDNIFGSALPNDACLNFVENIDRCTLTLTEIPVTVGSVCQNFIIEDLSYNGCVTAHKDEPDFYKKEWWLYLDRDQELWKSSRERIRLLDENGLLVGSVSY